MHACTSYTHTHAHTHAHTHTYTHTHTHTHIHMHARTHAHTHTNTHTHTHTHTRTHTHTHIGRKREQCCCHLLFHITCYCYWYRQNVFESKLSIYQTVAKLRYPNEENPVIKSVLVDCQVSHEVTSFLLNEYCFCTRCHRSQSVHGVIVVSLYMMSS